MLRSEVLVDLVREVLGPRNGPREVIEFNPVDEYITGVLQPAGMTMPPTDVEAMVENLPGGDAAGEEDMEDTDIPPSWIFSPALDPRARPSSIGLSFRAGTAGTHRQPVCEACVTWARYLRAEEPETGGDESRECQRQRRWRREPRGWRGPLLPGELYLNEQGPTTADQAEVSIHTRMEPDPDEPETWRVLVYVVNRIRADDAGRVRAENCIFQPQIRVVCGAGTWLKPVKAGKLRADPEETRLDFLYRDRPVMARGYLVGAVWREIDPEQPPPEGLEVPSGPPFVWVDGQILDNETRRVFSPPDVRTEFVPLYAVSAPDWEWPAEAGQEPELDARVLSEVAADGRELRRCLQPLVDGYGAWLRRQEEEAGRLSDPEAGIARSLLRECREVLRRMNAGLQLLAEEPDVRLSFAFAMRAMWMQATWAGRRTLRWRPFQLAFVLVSLESIVNPESPDRGNCDLLWVPTGGGKTEAYLALAAFTLAYRRRRALGRTAGDRTGLGTGVLSRYTLRLLTVQQFRRALAVIAVCERLRVDGLRDRRPAGWRPPGWPDATGFLWGSGPFAIGLWVGGNLTPNRLESIPVRDATGRVSRYLHGALRILEGDVRGEGEPAQVPECPACHTILAVPAEEGGLDRGERVLHLTVRMSGSGESVIQNVDRVLRNYMSGPGFSVERFGVHSLRSGEHHILSLHLRVERTVSAAELDRWWREGPGQHLELACFRASRPGYFPVRRPGRSGPVDFRIWCPAPDCPLASEWWCEGVPSVSPPPGRRAVRGVRWGFSVRHPESGEELLIPDGMYLKPVSDIWAVPDATSPGESPSFLACRVPVPALTVDEQLYRNPPSMVVATVDKFARLPFQPDAASLFGNVGFYHHHDGYSRNCSAAVRVEPLDPPDLILQDELHLIEGPLGSLAGLYEAAIEELCRSGTVRVKYVASTATIREAEAQVQALFARGLQIFPPPGLTAGDRFFLRSLREPHPLEGGGPGQLYVGICAPGRGPLTPLVRIWTCLLQKVYERRNDPDADSFWTLTGYFNAIRELAGVRALYRQDIPERLRERFSGRARPVSDDRIQELSSKSRSTRLPAILECLRRNMPEAPDALFATSMFGTGMDVPRLSLMVIHGQPKTCSAYIQAAGRVGRVRGALVVVFLRASRPRDLSHYEFFCGYHRQLHRYVEPVTVMPFSPGAMDLACGPVMVALLRNQRNLVHRWHEDETAPDMGRCRQLPEVQALPGILENRAAAQPPERRPPSGEVRRLAESELDRWSQYGRLHSDLRYVEYPVRPPLSSPVVLGDPEHDRAGLSVVFENVPQSLREIEETVGVEE